MKLGARRRLRAYRREKFYSEQEPGAPTPEPIEKAPIFVELSDPVVLLSMPLPDRLNIYGSGLVIGEAVLLINSKQVVPLLTEIEAPNPTAIPLPPVKVLLATSTKVLSVG